MLRNNVGLLHEPCLRVISSVFMSKEAAEWLKLGGGMEGEGDMWSVRYMVVDNEGRSNEGFNLGRRRLT